MKIKAYVFLFLAVAVFISSTPVYAQMDPEEVMSKVLQQDKATDEIMEVTMTLIDSGGQKRDRTATIYAKEKDPVNTMRLIRFHTPEDLANSAVLTIENSDRDNDQWIYVPAFHTTRRIASSNRSDNYMGTDFAYEDISDPRIKEYSYKTIKTDKCGDVDCVVIESTPVDQKLKDESGYSKTLSWVDTNRYITFKKEFYNKKGTLLKTQINSKLNKYGEKYRWDHVEMENVQSKHKTINDITERKLNTGLSDEYFTMRYLKRGG